MRFSLPFLALAALPFGPADSARAASVKSAELSIVAEIVIFQLNNDVDEAQFLKDAKATDAVVRAASGFLSRQLSKGEDGRWTDYILWQSLEQARDAAKTVVNDPAFGPFGSAINFETVVMRHERVLWQMQQ